LSTAPDRKEEIKPQSDLKACPFCNDGKYLVIMSGIHGNFFHVTCNQCGARSGYNASKEEAIRTWNYRDCRPSSNEVETDVDEQVLLTRLMRKYGLLEKVDMEIKPCCHKGEYEVELLEAIENLKGKLEEYDKDIGDQSKYIRFLQGEIDKEADKVRELRSSLDSALGLLELANGELVVDDGCCACHISPPCHFCIENNTTIEFKEDYKRFLSKLQAAQTNPSLTTADTGDFQTKSPSSASVSGKAEEVREPSAEDPSLLSAEYVPSEFLPQGCPPFDVIKANLVNAQGKSFELFLTPDEAILLSNHLIGASLEALYDDKNFHERFIGAREKYMSAMKSGSAQRSEKI
jgi:hypothetical protein